jgi:hypothetical protein
MSDTGLQLCAASQTARRLMLFRSLNNVGPEPAQVLNTTGGGTEKGGIAGQEPSREGVRPRIEGSAEFDYAPATRVAYSLNKAWAVAAEESEEFGPLRGFYAANQQHQLFEVPGLQRQALDCRGWGRSGTDECHRSSCAQIDPVARLELIAAVASSGARDSIGRICSAAGSAVNRGAGALVLLRCAHPGAVHRCGSRALA